MTKDQKWYSITITDTNRIMSESNNITTPLTQMLVSIERGNRFKVFAYQAKNGNKVFLIPAIAFDINPNLLENYQKVEVIKTMDQLALESFDGLYQPIVLPD